MIGSEGQCLFSAKYIQGKSREKKIADNFKLVEK